MDHVSTVTPATSRGRHPLLKDGTLAHQVYTQLLQNPDGLTMPQLLNLTLGAGTKQSINGCIQRMKAQNLVYAEPNQKGNRVVTVYKLIQANATGRARDTVEIECVFTVNEYGEYGVKSRVVGGLPTAYEDNPREIHVHRFYAAVPRPGEVMKSRVATSVEGHIIDADDASIDMA